MCVCAWSAGPGPSEAYGPGQMSSGAVQDMQYPRGPPSGPQPGMGAGPRPPYHYGPTGYESRRYPRHTFICYTCHVISVFISVLSVMFDCISVLFNSLLLKSVMLYHSR